MLQRSQCALYIFYRVTQKLP